MNRSPEAAANGILGFAWADHEGEIRLPIDAVAIALRLGIQVFEDDLPTHISGSLSKQIGGDPVIMLSRRDSDARKRFTTAHELGHFDEHAAIGDDDEFETIDERRSLSGPGQPPSERYANQFAAALLMPEPLLRPLAAKGTSVLEMADTFGVSAEAMNYRLRNLGLI